jgi:predicted phosphohydrolase
MLQIRYFSDLHLEFIKPSHIESFIRNIPPGMDEICICAGDIGNPYQPNYDIFMNFINKHFKKTFVIAGNHEYYNKTKTIEETTLFLQNYFTKFENICFLNNQFEIYENHCFIGTTLWSKITNPRYKINDVYEIPRFNYIQYNELHRLSVEFLENALQNNNNCIVITHHLPSDSLTHVKYKNDMLLPYNQWFFCHLDELIETYKNKIKCWVYGHTHTVSNNTISDIPFLCNPIGYPGENYEVDFQKTVIL